MATHCVVCVCARVTGTSYMCRCTELNCATSRKAVPEVTSTFPGPLHNCSNCSCARARNSNSFKCCYILNYQITPFHIFEFTLVVAGFTIHSFCIFEIRGRSRPTLLNTAGVTVRLGVSREHGTASRAWYHVIKVFHRRRHTSTATGTGSSSQYPNSLCVHRQLLATTSTITLPWPSASLHCIACTRTHQPTLSAHFSNIPTTAVRQPQKLPALQHLLHPAPTTSTTSATTLAGAITTCRFAV